MKIVIQRVSRCRVSVNDETVSEIGKGLLVLVGVHIDDTAEKADFLAAKLSKLRIMSDENNKMNLTIKDASGEMLIVSQFTLYSDTSGGNRPSFIKAARPEIALPVYNRLIGKLKEHAINVQAGSFGNYMKIDADLDGPVTIIMEN